MSAVRVVLTEPHWSLVKTAVEFYRRHCADPDQQPLLTEALAQLAAAREVFDRAAYQRKYMRQWRKKQRRDKSKVEMADDE